MNPEQSKEKCRRNRDNWKCYALALLEENGVLREAPCRIASGGNRFSSEAAKKVLETSSTKEFAAVLVEQLGR